jgi:hypothetical protein
MGSLLYGIDVGIIVATLLYLGKTISQTVQQTSVHCCGRVAPRNVLMGGGVIVIMVPRGSAIETRSVRNRVLVESRSK